MSEVIPFGETKEEKTRRIIAKAASSSSAVFAKSWLEGITPAVHQYEISKRIDDSHPNDMILIARDHGKSVLASLAYPLRLVCENPDIRILIVQKTKSQGIKALTAIKEQLEFNKRLRAYYAPIWEARTGYTDITNPVGAISVGTEKLGAWQQDRIYVKRKRVSRDPTIEVVGVGGSITGGRADVIILDDVLDDENTRTETRRQYIREWFEGTISQLREPWTKTILIGTPKSDSEDDLYQIAKASPSWRCFEMPAILYPEHFEDIQFEPILDKDGIVVDVEIENEEDIITLWPEKWGIHELLLEYTASLDKAVWRREKLLDLGAMKGDIFKKEDFKRYTNEDLRRIVSDPSRQIIITADSAWSTEKGADWTAVVVGVKSGNILYILEVIRKRLDISGIEDLLTAKWMEYSPHIVGIEDAASGKAILHTLKRDTGIPIKALSHGGRDKVSRARAATPYISSGRVRLPAEAPWLGSFLYEVAGFPKVAHDDQVDALVYNILEVFSAGKGIYI